MQINSKEPDPVSCYYSEEKQIRIRQEILNHPYFKNPGKYSIRLLTILKYLKRKGYDMSHYDVDILVNNIVLSISGVKSDEFGKYFRHK